MVQKNHRVKEPEDWFISMVMYTSYNRYGRTIHTAYVSNPRQENQRSTLSIVFGIKNVKYHIILNVGTEKQGTI